MNRAAWLKVIEQWFHKAQIENQIEKLPGYAIPKGVPVFAGAVVPQDDGSMKLRVITVVLREVAATFGEHVHGRVTGTYLVADTEACVLVSDDKCSFVPWEEIVFIES